MTSIGDIKLRAAIQFCVGLGKTPTQTYKLVQEAKTVKKCCRSLVFKWHRQFKEGRTSIEDDTRRGRPAEKKVDIVKTVKDLLDKDRRLTIRTISTKLDIPATTVHRILKRELHMSKVSARWVPRLLTQEQKSRRVECATEFLNRYEREGSDFLDNIITMDETWIWEFDPETKAESIWKTPSSPVPKKTRVSKSGGKHMFVFFMDRKGMLLIHKVPIVGFKIMRNPNESRIFFISGPIFTSRTSFYSVKKDVPENVRFSQIHTIVSLLARNRILNFLCQCNVCQQADVIRGKSP